MSRYIQVVSGQEAKQTGSINLRLVIDNKNRGEPIELPLQSTEAKVQREVARWRDLHGLSATEVGEVMRQISSALHYFGSLGQD